jgi:hypothetical protein
MNWNDLFTTEITERGFWGLAPIGRRRHGAYFPLELNVGSQTVPVPPVAAFVRTRGRDRGRGAPRSDVCKNVPVGGILGEVPLNVGC